MFSKNIRIIYLYIVSFISLMIFIGGLISLSSCVARYFYPTDYAIYSYPDYENIDEVSKEEVVESSEDVAKNEEQVQEQIRLSKISALRDVVTAIVTVVIATSLYAYHWRMVQKEREQV